MAKILKKSFVIEMLREEIKIIESNYSLPLPLKIKFMIQGLKISIRRIKEIK
jgi:hypothetical protein